LGVSVETELDAFVFGEFSDNLHDAEPRPESVTDEELVDVSDGRHAELQYGFGKLCLFLCTIPLTFVPSLPSDDELMDDSTYFTDGQVADSRYDLRSKKELRSFFDHSYR